MTNFTPIPDGRPQDDLIGEVLEGRYRVDRVLGRGGMGSVYLAQDLRMRCDVVVKVPHARFLEEAGFRERFEREIDALKRLPHPHIVKAHDVGRIARSGGAEPIPYAILEYLPGGSLKDRIANAGGRLASAEVADWLPPIAQALDFIHGRGVVHRDLKPGNVLFNDSAHVFLADFGIAKSLGSADTGLTRTGMTPGSPDYMAPEGGMSTSIGPAYDQYSLGVVVYEAIAGRLPHIGETPVMVLLKKHTEPVPPLSITAPNVPSAAASAVMRALAKEPAQRFPSCGAFAQAFADGLKPSNAGPRRTDASTRDSHTPALHTLRDRAPRPNVGRRLRPVVGLLLLASGAAYLALKPGGPSDSGGGGGGGVIAVPAALAVFIDAPADGSLLPARDIRVTGRVTGSPSATVQVNGSSATRKGDAFEVTIRADADGALLLDAGARAPGLTDAKASRRIEIDTMPPTLEVTFPVGNEVTLPSTQATLTVRGRADDQHLASVTVDGAAVAGLQADGSFVASVELAEGEEKSISLVATDKARHASASTTIRIRREKAPPTGTPYGSDVADATSKALGGDWEAAKAAWAKAVAKGARPADAPRALLDGIASYDAAPVLDVTEPDDGATVRESLLHVRGTLSSGRATDEVLVNGTLARTGPGSFDATMPLPAVGRIRILVGVEDRGFDRGPVIERTVTYAKDTPTSLSASAVVLTFLSDWAAPEGTANDGPTGFPKRIRRTKDGAVMVLIPAGTFQMGAVPSDTRSYDDEKPRHSVTISNAYYLDETEVTVGMWKKYVAVGSGTLPTGIRSEATGAHPIHNVSWGDVQGFLKWAQVSLPTEAQWERAAKGGHDDFVYPWGAADDEKKRNGGSGDGFEGLAPAKSFAANDYGLFDMSGNVSEWCADGYLQDYYTKSPDRDPLGPESASARAIRGGAGDYLDRFLRASFRFGDLPGRRYDYLGFRCSRSLTEGGPVGDTPAAAPVRAPVHWAALQTFLAGWAAAEGTEKDTETGYPKRIRRTKDGAVMVLIPAGTFQMGVVPSDGQAGTDEGPRHAVTLSKAYYLDESEVTVRQWKKYVRLGGGTMPSGGNALLSGVKDAHPMREVSWNDAQGFLKWAQVSLPTEAQWERAAKGGHDDFVYPWGATDDEKKRNGIGNTDGFEGFAPVKSFAANDYGLFDMCGNIWEWCADGYVKDFYAKSPNRDPLGPESASARAVRGGSCCDDDRFLRASYRSDYTLAKRSDDLGFRCARSLP